VELVYSFTSDMSVLVFNSGDLQEGMVLTAWKVVRVYQAYQ